MAHPGKPTGLAARSKIVPLRSTSAQGKATTRRAIVLGSGGSADLIARQLRNEGFEAETAGEPLPSLSDPDALDKLKELLAKYARRTGAASCPPGTAPCVHPGVSVWAERAELATLGEELGLDVICPPTRILSLFSNKLNFLTAAEQAGVPHLVLGFEPMYSIREIERLVYNQALQRKPFPFILKAVRGGGSFGLQVIHNADDLERRIPLWVDQVRRNLGEVTVFAERYIEGARHIVVPFVRYLDGRFQTFPMTDASLQSRHRKIIEFCPAGGMSSESEALIKELTRKFADHCNYVGVGTLEFLVEESRAFLIEGSARLNTGFHLWERVAGTSAVAWQLSALEGGEPGDEPGFAPRREWAAGIALRLYAEDSLLGLPQPGEVREVLDRREWHFDNPEHGVTAELDLQVASGGRIAPSDYGMVGMLWAGARDRKQAMIVARGVLDELWIAGSLQTNERFLGELLNHPWVREGIFHAGFVDEEFLPAARPAPEILKAFPLVLQSVKQDVVAGAPTARWAVGDQWVRPDPSPDSVFRWVKGPEEWKMGGLQGISGAIELEDGRTFRVCAYPVVENRWQVRIGSWVLSVRKVMSSPAEKTRGSRKLTALIHGRIHSILYQEGSVVPAHEPLLIMDALGMLVPHALPVDVRISRWSRKAEDIVHIGQELGEFELTTKN